ncbi:pre-mRNA branch site p14-like protein [Striga asiatica]|uniref:Pre-mRNA branch site p14-like protein n=1 Tax=Striga asiatica TaxID=4170 RepID=A0A5A7R4Z7_STRAF|nr:pre-mRNA branch site p14-like protein [Striga asiatica]
MSNNRFKERSLISLRQNQITNPKFRKPLKFTSLAALSPLYNHSLPAGGQPRTLRSQPVVNITSEKMHGTFWKYGARKSDLHQHEQRRARFDDIFNAGVAVEHHSGFRPTDI